MQVIDIISKAMQDERNLLLYHILPYPDITSIDLNPVFTSSEGSLVTDVGMMIAG